MKKIYVILTICLFVSSCHPLIPNRKSSLMKLTTPQNFFEKEYIINSCDTMPLSFPKDGQLITYFKSLKGDIGYYLSSSSNCNLGNKSLLNDQNTFIVQKYKKNMFLHIVNRKNNGTMENSYENYGKYHIKGIFLASCDDETKSFKINFDSGSNISTFESYQSLCKQHNWDIYSANEGRLTFQIEPQDVIRCSTYFNTSGINIQRDSCNIHSLPIEKGHHKVKVSYVNHNKVLQGNEKQYTIKSQFEQFCTDTQKEIKLIPDEPPECYNVCCSNIFKLYIQKKGQVKLHFFTRASLDFFICDKKVSSMDEVNQYCYRNETFDVNSGDYHYIYVLNLDNNFQFDGNQCEKLQKRSKQYCISVNYTPSCDSESSNALSITNDIQDTSVPHQNDNIYLRTQHQPTEPDPTIYPQNIPDQSTSSRLPNNTTPQIPQTNSPATKPAIPGVQQPSYIMKIGHIDDDKKFNMQLNPKVPVLISFRPENNSEVVLYIKNFDNITYNLYGNIFDAKYQTNQLKHKSMDGRAAKYEVDAGRTYFYRIDNTFSQIVDKIILIQYSSF